MEEDLKNMVFEAPVLCFLGSTVLSYTIFFQAFEFVELFMNMIHFALGYSLVVRIRNCLLTPVTGLIAL